MNRFYKIENADGKCWLLPVRELRVGLALYQPSGWKGRLLKRWLPVLHWSRLVRRALRINSVWLSLTEFFLSHTEDIVSHGTHGIHGNAVASPAIGSIASEVFRIVCEAFGVAEFRYSVFCGTPSVHQKTTIQVWNRERILGYVKMTESEAVGRLFVREAEFLKKVNGQRSTLRRSSGAEANGLLMPKAEAMRIGDWWVLIQSTRKSLRSKVVHEWGVLQERFLEDLYRATATEMAWKESDVAQSVRALREHVEWLPDGVDGDAVARCVDALMERMMGKRVMYGAYHGDFTPWNMFVENGELFVFDWEYAGWSYPKGLDRYHYWMQTAIFEKHWGAEELKCFIDSPQGKWVDRELLEIYLLDVMSKYVMREGGKVKELGCFGVWGGMLG